MISADTVFVSNFVYMKWHIESFVWALTKTDVCQVIEFSTGGQQVVVISDRFTKETGSVWPQF